MSDPKSPSIALIPYYRDGVHQHYRSVREARLQVIEAHQDSSIDAARAVLLESGLRSEGIDIFVFIDADIEFTRAGYDQIVESCVETEGVVGGVYVTKENGPTVRIIGMPLTLPVALQCHDQGRIYPAALVGMGLTAIHRRACEKMAAAADLPKIWFPLGRSAIQAHPFFMPLIRDGRYLREDYSFCTRARDAGVQVWMDTRPVLVHHGSGAFQMPSGVLNLSDGTAETEKATP